MLTGFVFVVEVEIYEIDWFMFSKNYAIVLITFNNYNYFKVSYSDIETF